MNVAGLVLAVLGARTAAQSIVKRIENFRQAPETFRALRENLEHLNNDIDAVDAVLSKFPNALLADISPIFSGVLDRVRESLLQADATIEKDFSEPFGQSSRDFVGSVKSAARRILRATKLKDKMASVELQIKDSSFQLQHLTTQLVSALNSLELHNTLIPKLDDLASADSAGEVYCPASSTPGPCTYCQSEL